MKKSTKLMLLLGFVAAFFFSFCILTFASDVWDGTVSTDAPEQNARGYYLCKNGRELAWAANRVNSGYTNLKIMLTQDIYLNDVENNIYINLWTPIGNEDRKFEGYFEGNNHFIYGLKINSSEKYQGLFGYLSGASVNGVKLYYTDISSQQYVGGICGYAASNSVISNCIVSGNIYSSSGDCGGISGYGRIGVNISNCGVKGSVSSEGNRVAGIVGCCASNAVVEKCYNNANVSSNGKFVGGIVGTSSGSTVTSCYNTGDIYGATRAGGIVGNNVGDVYVSYNCGSITSPKEKGAICGFNSIAEVKNCYYLEGCCDSFDEYAIEKTSTELKRYAFIVSMNKNGGDYIIDYQEENDGYPVLSWTLESEVWARGIRKPSFYVDGETYLITSAEELAWFAALVNGTLEDTPQNQYAKAILTKSIILNLADYDEEYSNVWTPIGSGGAEFFGVFDGNGKTVSGVVVNEGEYAGLFGSVRAGAVVKNLKIDKAHINGQYAGGVAGNNLGNISVIEVTLSNISADIVSGGIVGENEGVISECAFSSSTVLSQSKCGGITGVNEGTISSCYNTSPVSASSYVGGIAGENRGTITCCFNSADISSSDNYCAGIAGYCVSASVTKCYNTGKISGKSIVGGITGYSRHGEITACYDVGEVSSSGVHGAVCASAASTTISAVYYDSQRISATDNYASALTTSQMTGSTAISHLSGFNRSDWATTAESDYFYFYPQLAEISSSGNFEYYYDSLESVKFLKYEFHCKVDINESISYYSTFKQACDAIGDKTAVLYIFEDMTFADCATVNGNVTVIADKANVTVKRAEGYLGSIFDINGELTLGGKKDSFVVTFDGSLQTMTSCESLIKVENTGTFNLVKVYICGNTASDGGAVYNLGTANFLGGEIYECISFDNGAAVYNRGEALFDGALIHNNTSFTNGGAVCNDSSGFAATVASGRFYSNQASNGGAIYSISGKVIIQGAQIDSNTASYGGAVYVNTGTVEVRGGEIFNNSADFGSAAYNSSGTLSMGDDGFIDQSNDVYLPAGKTVTMISKLDSSSVCVNITPERYQKDIRVVDGAFAAANYKRVYINDYQTQNWHINSSGHLLTDEVVEVALVSILGAHSVYYTSLEEAFDDIGENDAIITLVDDVTVSETLAVRSNITLLSDSQARTVSGSDDLSGPIFEIRDNCSLVLGDISNNESNDILYIDGSVHKDSIIKVLEGGTLTMYNGSVLCNMESESFSLADVYGEMNIYGGKVLDNDCDFGAVRVENGAELNVYGGQFENDNVSVFKTGDMTFYGNSSLGSNIVQIDDGVISLDDEYSCDSTVATIKFDRYALGTLCVSTNLDKTVYKSLFKVYDDCYYLDDEMKIAADMLELKSTTALLWEKEQNYIYGIDVDVNTAENISSQFKNSNIVIFNENGQMISITDLCGTKYKVCLVDSNGDVYDWVYILIYGDVNYDGCIDGEDAVYINMAYYGFMTIDDALILEAADVNHDGIVDLSDAWMLEDAGIYNNNVLQKTGG